MEDKVLQKTFSQSDQRGMDTLLDAKSIYIYGAGDVARSVGYCMMSEPFCKTIMAFVVSDPDREAEKSLLGYPIISFREMDRTVLVLIAVMERYRDEIIKNLEEVGARNFLLLTFENNLWCSIRERFVKHWLLQKGIRCTRIDEIQRALPENGKAETDLKVFVVKSDVDKPIKQEIPRKEWETDIQVGAVLTDKRISSVSDDTGDSISYKNRQYCEMTALYWIWKNTNYKYVGLCHYRRRFDIKLEDIERIVRSKQDLVITVPIINVPNVKYAYEKTHCPEDWEVFRQAVHEISPEYDKAFCTMENGRFYIPYNMFIMRRGVLEKYCEWAFSIFGYCEEHLKKKKEGYQRRDIGFLSERVMTVYLMHHFRELQIVYAGKTFYE